MTTIRDLCLSIGSGSTPSRKRPEFFIGDIPWLKTKELADATVFDTEEKVSALALERSSCKLLPAGAVVMAMYGATVGKLGILGRQMTTNQACCAMVTNPDLLDNRYLFYWLKRNRREIQDLSNGAAQQNLSVRTIGAIEIEPPSVVEQVRISRVLGSLDDKIAANTEAVRTIDRLRNALWHRNIEDGTTAVPLSSLASFVNGGAFTKNATGTGRVVVRIAEMSSGIGNNTVRNELDVSETKVVKPGELLFSWSGTLMTKRWPYDEAIVNQHIFKVIPDHGFPLAFLDCAIEQQLNFFKMIAAGKATTMGHIKRSDLDAEVQIPIQFREEDLRLAESLWANASALEKENMILAKTRDELLPLLMNGKITVGEAGQEAAAVGAQIPSEENKV